MYDGLIHFPDGVHLHSYGDAYLSQPGQVQVPTPGSVTTYTTPQSDVVTHVLPQPDTVVYPLPQYDSVTHALPQSDTAMHVIPENVGGLILSVWA